MTTFLVKGPANSFVEALRNQVNSMHIERKNVVVLPCEVDATVMRRRLLERWENQVELGAFVVQGGCRLQDRACLGVREEFLHFSTSSLCLHLVSEGVEMKAVVDSLCLEFGVPGVIYRENDERYTFATSGEGNRWFLVG